MLSESFESLCEGLQNAVWELGKVPRGAEPIGCRTAINDMTVRRRSSPNVMKGCCAITGSRARRPGRARRPKTATWSSDIIA